ncbi:cathepsin L1 [Drosophila busckii]|uniref:cathepsin L1 n=1 Tax=Drosophila busckii TaxID=30019 RepID=UPI00083EB657|nr:cathepsin L1 [Drosophila busckii]
MFKIIALLAVVAFVAATSTTQQLNAEFSVFQTEFDREYGSVDEQLQRRQIFINNKLFINAHNERFEAGLETFELGVNQFTDLTFEEFERLFLSKLNPDNVTVAEEFVAETAVQRDGPASIDWRKRGAVTAVKDQGQCGSCWAFSAMGALEAAWHQKTKKLVALSEQNLVDCSREQYGNYGCRGGWPEAALKYVIANKGINSQKTYPYTAKQGKCQYKPKAVAARVKRVVKVASRNELALRRAAALRPISVAIAVTAYFQSYKSGVLNDPKCSYVSVNHAVLVVGYGKAAKGGDYWLVKNSWGKRWGEAGYIRMSRNRNNQCKIADYAIYPEV